MRWHVTDTLDHQLNITESSHQVEVSVLCCSIFGWHFLDMSLFDKLIGWVNYVLLSPKPLVNLQQFVHLLLETSGNRRMSKSRSRKEQKSVQQIPPERIIVLSGSHWQETGVMFLYWFIKSFVCLSCLKDVRNASIMGRQRKAIRRMSVKESQSDFYKLWNSRQETAASCLL